MRWLPQRRAGWIWAALLPLTWLGPAMVGLNQLRRTVAMEDGPVLFGLLGAALLPFLVGLPTGWAVRPVGLAGWLWLLANILFGAVACAIVGFGVFAGLSL